MSNTSTEDNNLVGSKTERLEIKTPDNIVITLAKPQYAYKNFGYFKVDFKAPSALPKVHFIETRQIPIETRTMSPIESLCTTFQKITTNPSWNSACLIRRAIRTFDEDNPKPANLGPCFRRADNFNDVKTSYIPFDLDAMPVDPHIALDTPDKVQKEVDAYVKKYLPKAFHNVNYVLQLTPSFRPLRNETHEAKKSRSFEKHKLHVRLYYLLETPLYTAQIMAYPWSDLDEEDKLSIGLEPNKIHCCVDRSIYRACQPIYIANPVFENEEDPLKACPELKRIDYSNHHPQDVVRFDISDVPFETDNNQRHEIRTVQNLPGIEGAYSRQADWSDLLSQFGYYQESGFGEQDRWISPDSDSASAGVLINRDGRVWSHHSPEHCMIAKTGRMLTAFDFVREFIFNGNYKAALAFAVPIAKTDKKYQEEQNELSNKTIVSILEFINIPNEQRDNEQVMNEYDCLMQMDSCYRIIVEEVIRGSFYDHLAIDKTYRLVAKRLGIDDKHAKEVYAELKAISKHIYDDVAKREAKSKKLDFLLDGVSDETNALALINAYGGEDTLLSYDDRTIYAYGSKYWIEHQGLTSQKGIVSKYSIDESVRRISLDDNKKTAITRSLHTEILRSTQRRFGFEDHFAMKANIIPLKNCVIDLSNWYNGSKETVHRPVIRGYQPTDHVVYPCNFKFEATAKCPKFMDFIHSIYPGHPELVKLQQHKFGYLLTSGNNFQKIFMQKGERRSGKGTLDRVASRLVPRGYFEPTTFEKLSGRFGQTVFRKAKIINIPDFKKGTLTGKSRNMVEEVIISATGGDMIAIEEKHARQEGIRPTGVLNISSNEIIDITNIDAFFSRMIVIPHMVSFEGKEDFGLEATLMNELPGILNWAIEGLYELGKQGRFIEPDISLVAKNEMIEVNSPMSSFVRQYYIVDKTVSPASCSTKEAFRSSYRAWLMRSDSSMSPEDVLEMTDDNTINAGIRAIIGSLESKYRRAPKRMNGKLVQTQYGLVIRQKFAQKAELMRKKVTNADDKMLYCLDTDDLSILWNDKYSEHDFGA